MTKLQKAEVIKQMILYDVSYKLLSCDIGYSYSYIQMVMTGYRAPKVENAIYDYFGIDERHIKSDAEECESYIEIVAEAKKQMVLHDLNNISLSELTGISQKTIYEFMNCNAGDDSIRKIADVLDIPICSSFTFPRKTRSDIPFDERIKAAAYNRQYYHQHKDTILAKAREKRRLAKEAKAYGA